MTENSADMICVCVCVLACPQLPCFEKHEPGYRCGLRWTIFGCLSRFWFHMRALLKTEPALVSRCRLTNNVFKLSFCLKSVKVTDILVWWPTVVQKKVFILYILVWLCDKFAWLNNERAGSAMIIVADHCCLHYTPVSFSHTDSGKSYL